jgi:lysozyme
MPKFINGIDVSRWQGPDIDWKKVKLDGYLFSFMKASDGSAYKKQFIDIGIKQATEAKAAGLKTGYYHFSHPTNQGGLEKDAKDEANFFLKTIKLFPVPNFPLVLDLEDEKMTLTQAETEQWVISFKSVIEKAGYTLMMYSYRPYLDRVLSKAHKLGTMPLWLANYPREFDINKLPKNPAGWATLSIWQYSDKGQVKGITNIGTDLNIMDKNFFDKY